MKKYDSIIGNIYDSNYNGKFIVLRELIWIGQKHKCYIMVINNVEKIPYNELHKYTINKQCWLNDYPEME